MEKVENGKGRKWKRSKMEKVENGKGRKYKKMENKKGRKLKKWKIEKIEKFENFLPRYFSKTLSSSFRNSILHASAPSAPHSSQSDVLLASEHESTKVNSPSSCVCSRGGQNVFR